MDGDRPTSDGESRAGTRPARVGLGMALERLDLDRIAGVGGLRPISSFAAALPSEALDLAKRDASRLMTTVANLEESRRRTLFASLGAVSASQRFAAQETSLHIANAVGSLAADIARSGMTSQLTRFTEQISKTYRLEVADWASRVSLAATGIAEGVAQWREGMEEGIPAFVERHGWPVPLTNLPAKAVWWIVDLVDAPKRQVNSAMIQNFGPRSRLYRENVRSLLASPLIASRRQPLRQAIRAHERGDYYAAICTMLPLVEGLIADAAWAGASAPRRKVVQRGVAELQMLDEVGWGWMQRSLEVVLISGTSGLALFESYSPEHREQLAVARSLNRHAVVHGISRRYGTAVNALRLFLLLASLEEALAEAKNARVGPSRERL